MINNELKCIFVEIPKTGSTSIRSIIGNPDKPHKNILQIKNEMNYEDFLSYFKFSMVRNPWDRVVSLYNRSEGLQMSDKMSFNEFVDWINFSSDTSIHPKKHKCQLDWIRDEKGEILVDFIGKFENLDEDWLKISKKLSINQKLPHLNNNIKNKINYQEYYTTKTKAIIYEKFREDIEFFDYKF